ncbi:hypothetical protein B0H11DRAFT_1903645 [Mycena galericulata]|nr:hypothetical protein B0H11DRAFT_1903645 [Mycena galericulata]
MRDMDLRWLPPLRVEHMMMMLHIYLAYRAHYLSESKPRRPSLGRARPALRRKYFVQEENARGFRTGEAGCAARWWLDVTVKALSQARRQTTHQRGGHCRTARGECRLGGIRRPFVEGRGKPRTPFRREETGEVVAKPTSAVRTRRSSTMRMLSDKFSAGTSLQSAHGRKPLHHHLKRLIGLGVRPPRNNVTKRNDTPTCTATLASRGCSWGDVSGVAGEESETIRTAEEDGAAVVEFVDHPMRRHAIVPNAAVVEFVVLSSLGAKTRQRMISAHSAIETLKDEMGYRRSG